MDVWLPVRAWDGYIPARQAPLHPTELVHVRSVHLQGTLLDMQWVSSTCLRTCTVLTHYGQEYYYYYYYHQDPR